jgi:hypothetical protein
VLARKLQNKHLLSEKVKLILYKETWSYSKTKKSGEKKKVGKTNLFRFVGNGMSPSPFKDELLQRDSRLQLGTKCLVRTGTEEEGEICCSGKLSQRKGKENVNVKHFNIMQSACSVSELGLQMGSHKIHAL